MEHAAFSPIGFVAVSICASLNLLRQNPQWWRLVKNRAVLRQLVNVLTRCAWNTLEEGVLDSFKELGPERGTVGLHQGANGVSRAENQVTSSASSFVIIGERPHSGS